MFAYSECRKFHINARSISSIESVFDLSWIYFEARNVLFLKSSRIHGLSEHMLWQMPEHDIRASWKSLIGQLAAHLSLERP